MARPWLAERECDGYESPSARVYTQIVRGDTKEVGCSVARGIGLRGLGLRASRALDILGFKQRMLGCQRSLAMG